MSCAKPVADFHMADGAQTLKAPLHLQLRNLSTNASSYEWRVNGHSVSTQEDLDHMLLESGRHIVELTANEANKSAKKTKEVILMPPMECHVIFRTTAGDMVFRLLEDTPGHLANITERIESGYYDGLLFHRVIDDFMIQGGDNKSRSGGRRYDEPQAIPAEITPAYPHYRGALAAARMPDDINPDKESSGSQFYIVDGRALDDDKMASFQKDKYFDYTEEQLQTYTDQGGAPQLDGEYTVFGYMTHGWEVLDQIAGSATDKYDRPLTEIKITEVRFLN